MFSANPYDLTALFISSTIAFVRIVDLQAAFNTLPFNGLSSSRGLVKAVALASLNASSVAMIASNSFSQLSISTLSL